MSAEAENREERLYRLSEELADALAAGASIDGRAYAQRFSVGEDDVRRVLRALEWLEEPELADLREDEPRPIPRPEVPADFEIVEELGRGGMGIVYRAHQRSLDREIALKVLLPGELVFGDALARFRREAKSLARLRHPHIVTIHEVGEHAGRVFYTMDLIEGAPLSRLVRAGEVSIARAVHLVRQVAGAIAYVHQRGLLHRDLKPQNVLVDARGDAFVVDFGLARDEGGRADALTGSGRLLGTPAYMAPEQARGDRALIGEATDVYALGATLYECLTGRPPFGGLGIAETIHGVLHREPTPMRKLDPRIPPPLEWIVQRAMAKDQAERYPTAQALQEDLERFEEGRTVLAEPPSLARRTRLLLRREKKVLLAVLVTLLLVASTFEALVRPRLGPSRDALLQLAAELEARGESDAAAALLEPLLAGARGDLVTFRSWVLARLTQLEAALERGDAGRVEQLEAEVSAAIAERRTALNSGEPLADAELRALDVLTARTAAACGALPELSYELVSASHYVKLPPSALTLVWRWIDTERVDAAPWPPNTSDSLRSFAHEMFEELADPGRANLQSLVLASALLCDRPELVPVFEAYSAIEGWLRMAGRMGEHLPVKLTPLHPRGEMADLLDSDRDALSWTDMLVSVPEAKLIEWLGSGGPFGRTLLAWIADLPPGADEPDIAARVLTLPGDDAEALRRSRLEGLESNAQLRGWLGTRALDAAASVEAGKWVSRLATELRVEAVLEDRPRLLHAFDYAKGEARRKFHLLFSLLDTDPAAPRWPGLGHGAREPRGLATAWHLRWGAPPPTDWRVQFSRWERESWSAPLRFVSSTVLVPDAKGELRYEEEFARGWWIGRGLDRVFLDGGTPPWSTEAKDAVAIVLLGQIGWGALGLGARWTPFPPHRRQRGPLSIALECAAIFPGHGTVLARVLENQGRRGELLYLAHLVPLDEDEAEWTEEQWLAKFAAAIGPGVSRDRVLAAARMLLGDAAVITDLAAYGIVIADLGLPDLSLARLWITSPEASLRAAAREAIDLHELDPDVRAELALALDARGEEVPLALRPMLAGAAGRSRQIKTLQILLLLVLGCAAFAGFVGARRRLRRVGLQHFLASVWQSLRKLSSAHVPLLLATPIFLPRPPRELSGALLEAREVADGEPTRTLVVLAASALLAVLAARRNGATRAWITPVLLIAALLAQAEGSLQGRALATFLWPLAYLSIFACLFERWLFPGTSRWRHAVWLPYVLVLSAPFANALQGFALTFELSGSLDLRLAALRLRAFDESGVSAIIGLFGYSFLLWYMAHAPLDPQLYSRRMRSPVRKSGVPRTDSGKSSAPA